MDKQMSLMFAAVIAAFFLIGVFAGCFMASRASGEASEYLAGYVLRLADEGIESSHNVVQAIVNSFLFPAMVFILSFTVFGAVAIPLIIAVRAFFFSFAIASFIRSFGNAGILLALGALGPQNMLSLPCLFILAIQGMISSFAVIAVFSGKQKKPGGFYGKKALFRSLVCSLALSAAALFEIYLIPSLFSTIAANV